VTEFPQGIVDVFHTIFAAMLEPFTLNEPAYRVVASPESDF